MDLAQRVSSFFAPGGTLARAHPAYEPRAPQQAFALDVLQALVEGGHLVAEAGTGTGKTLAYLVPAILQGGRILVSTGTKTLQDQLAQQDLPFLRDRCGLPFTWCVLKGRDNYLCLHRFEAFRERPSFGRREEGAHWPAVLAWAEETATGDVAELKELPESPSFWPEVNARASTCLGARCPQHDACHLHELRRAAQSAEVVVVNHHLFLADAALRESAFGAILPDAHRVIFDEAHRLEGAATSFFGRTVSNWRLRELADDVVRELSRAGFEQQGVLRAAKRLAEAAAGLPGPWAGREGRLVLPARLSPAQDDALQAVGASLGDLARRLRSPGAIPPAAEPLARRTDELIADLQLICRREDPGWVFWSETRGRGLFLSATPVEVSELLRERVFRRLEASVLCSATLAVEGGMKHVRARLGLDLRATPSEDDAGAEPLRVRDAVHASPFDFASQGLLYLPRDMPAPRDPRFASACARRMGELLRASRGRAFLLFTSFENLRRVHEILRAELAFPLHVQGEAPKTELLRRFRQEPGSVLFATASFWEGVDVPGAALSLVAIDKLPFAVPTDPIVAARSRLLEEAGGSSFRELALPEAVLALKQGVGRLIRSRTDRGVVAVLDRRVLGTGWGRAFVRNLPPLRRTSQLEEVERFFSPQPESS